VLREREPVEFRNPRTVSTKPMITNAKTHRPYIGLPFPVRNILM
jgi:hypothetical protein